MIKNNRKSYPESPDEAKKIDKARFEGRVARRDNQKQIRREAMLKDSEGNKPLPYFE